MKIYFKFKNQYKIFKIKNKNILTKYQKVNLFYFIYYFSYLYCYNIKTYINKIFIVNKQIINIICRYIKIQYM